MFNLLVSGAGWTGNHGSLRRERLFEQTSDRMVDRFTTREAPNFEALRSLPTIFMEESFKEEDPVVRVGFIQSVVESGRELHIDYLFDDSVPSFTNNEFRMFASELGVSQSEFSRTHWAVKEADLFRSLLRHLGARRQKARVFNLNDPPRIEPSLVSAMMPFQHEFGAVYAMLKSVADDLELHCRRADDIWENPAVIQDVVSLIDRSAVVICDCTGRNPNVFYEAGIAHTLGREVVLITQSEGDIPFDLRHLRYVKYLNNGEGRFELGQKLKEKLRSLFGIIDGE